MKLFIEIFGQGRNLNVLQMGCRGVVVFLIALVLIRISGRRSFGLRMPLDNIIVILLGATLSRGIVGATPFVSVVITCFVIVILHRIFGLMISRWKYFSRIMEGKKFLLYSDGEFIDNSLKKALVCKEDVMQGVRKSALTDDMDKVDRVYMERNGEISAILKDRE